MATMELYTFGISHFSEKLRWTLDASGLAYRERLLTPGLHMPRTLLMTRRASSVPILVADGAIVQDSARILRWLAEHRAEAIAPLWPRDATQRADFEALESRYAGIGTAVLRHAYAGLLDDEPLLLRAWTLDAGAFEAGLLRRVMPLMLRGFRRRFGISPAGVARAGARIATALDELDARLAGGERYLVGQRFGVADITVSALLAPLACPDEHPVYGSAPMRAAMAPRVAQWQSRPALEWVRRNYREHRPAVAAGFAAARTRLEA